MSAIEMTGQRIKASGLIAIVRGDFSVGDTLRIGDALFKGTITAMEVTLNTPSALTSLPKLRSHFGEQMLVGAGTVRDVNQARAAYEAGAQFLISPYFDPHVVSFALPK